MQYILLWNIKYLDSTFQEGGEKPLISVNYKFQGQTLFNSLRPKRICCHFTDDILKCIFLNEKVWISLIISLKFVPKVQINNISAMVQMAWCRPGDKPSSELMMVSLVMHICVTRPHWVKKAWKATCAQLNMFLIVEIWHVHMHEWVSVCVTKTISTIIVSDSWYLGGSFDNKPSAATYMTLST